jgi:hypothetical protein
MLGRTLAVYAVIGLVLALFTELRAWRRAPRGNLVLNILYSMSLFSFGWFPIFVIAGYFRLIDGRSIPKHS